MRLPAEQVNMTEFLGQVAEDEQQVRCNWCYSSFYEKYILLKEDEEVCPICKRTGYLMDLEPED